MWNVRPNASIDEWRNSIQLLKSPDGKFIQGVRVVPAKAADPHAALAQLHSFPIRDAGRLALRASAEPDLHKANGLALEARDREALARADEHLASAFAFVRARPANIELGTLIQKLNSARNDWIGSGGKPDLTVRSLFAALQAHVSGDIHLRPHPDLRKSLHAFIAALTGPISSDARSAAGSVAGKAPPG